jgi:CNT family concentrative nucleoside transporter
MNRTLIFLLLLLIALPAWAAEGVGGTPWYARLISLGGLFVMVGLGWLISVNRKGINWRPVAWGIGLQLAFALVVLSPAAQDYFFNVVDGGVRQLLSFAEDGADFLFQTVEPHQIVVGFGEGEQQTFIGRISPPVKTFAFWILPTIIFFSSLMSVLYHLGVMQFIVNRLARLMQVTMGTSGAESLSAAANIFVGQTEAPLVIKPYVSAMTKSELHAVMTGGFATVAGGVLAAYVGFLRDIPGIAGHLVTASILSAPAALAISKVVFPEDGTPATAGRTEVLVERSSQNAIEAAGRGANQGMTLALNVAAMLVAFVGLLAMVDWMLGAVPVRFCEAGVAMGYAEGCASLTLSQILGWAFTPIALAMGVPWAEAGIVGQLLGEKMVLTEFVAYIHLGEILSAAEPVLSDRSAIIASYALCGFANFASIGIQLGGIGGIAPERMSDLASLGLRAMLAGSLAAFMTATVAGALLG